MKLARSLAGVRTSRGMSAGLKGSTVLRRRELDRGPLDRDRDQGARRRNRRPFPEVISGQDWHERSRMTGGSQTAFAAILDGARRGGG